MSRIGEELLLAIDLGTSGPKVAVLTAKGATFTSDSPILINCSQGFWV